MLIRILVIIFMCLLFWLICFLNTGSDELNAKYIRNYHDNVIKKVKKGK